MTELNMDGGSIFVDVNTGQQYPILYTQLLNNGEERDSAQHPVQAKNVKEEVPVVLECQGILETMDVSGKTK